MYKLLPIIFLATILFSACKKNDSGLEDIPVIDTVEELDAIMESCRNNEFNSRANIEDNLIGKWQLIGIRSGWVNEFITQEITLNIDRNSITLTDHTNGEDSKTDWELKFVEVNTYKYFYLETDEDRFNNRIGMETFCPDYMYGSGRVDDGSTYVYAKVR